jgi:hypothetical protein
MGGEVPRATSSIPFDDILEQFIASPSTNADMERLNRFVESTLNLLTRLDPIWEVEEGMEWSAYLATVKKRALHTHPDEASIDDVLARLRDTASNLHHACKRGVIGRLPGHVSHRAYEMARRIDFACTIIAAAEQSCGRHVRTAHERCVLDPIAVTEADVLAATPPSDEATQQAMEAFATFISDTGGSANGALEQWEIKARAVRTLEAAIRATIAEVPDSFVLFDKAAHRLSAARVWYDRRTMPWTRLLSKTQNARNLGIVVRTNQQMLRLVERLVEKGLY